MRLTISLSLLALILFACSDDQNANQPEKVQKKTKTISKEALNSQIILLNDSLKNLSISRFMMDAKSDKTDRIAIETKISVLRQELINQNLKYFRVFSKDSLAPYCLINIYGIYDNIKAYDLSLNYLDTLEYHYPEFELPNLILDLRAVTLDYVIKPRDISKIKKAYEELLKSPDTNDEDAKRYKNRLLNIDKGFNDLIN
ncbi:MAG: hypothetical protein HOK92_05275 [Flavobacteriales bacterium]|jgi:hypothetical protein|nr:hypothetical protein [Flavobacteriales bacterium]